MEPEGLPSAERVRKRPDFERVYDTGLKVSGRYMVVFRLKTSLDRSRLGVAATRKIGGAVERNRAKRLAREIYRRHKPEQAHDVVIVPRRDMLDAPFDRLESEFVESLVRQGGPARRPGQTRPGRARSARAVARV